MENEIIIQYVAEQRKDMPRLGTRKLHFLIKKSVEAHNIKLGRDRLFNVLRDNNLHIKPKKSYTRTTLSNHWRKKYDDLRIDLVTDRSELLWVSDITYISTLEGFEYLSLISDEYCKKIVGWCCYPTLETLGCLKALKMALEQRKYPHRPLIHHSDRGAQYCSEAYTSILLDHSCKISVTQNGSPFENPMAESVNGIFKGEFNLDQTFRTRRLARSTVKQTIQIFNTRRPHGSIDYLTPNEAYYLTGPIPSRWRKK